jgi:hypothetical protein
VGEGEQQWQQQQGQQLKGRLKGGGCSTNTERGGSMASSGRGTCKGRVSMRRRGGRLQELPQGRRGRQQWQQQQQGRWGQHLKGRLKGGGCSTNTEESCSRSPL